MPRLTETQIEEGRRLVLGGDIDSVMNWARKHAPVGLTHEVYERTMRLCFLAGDFAKAIKMHNAVFDTYDVDVERAGIAVRKFVGCAIALALVGGIGAAVLGVVLLVRAVFS